MSEHGREQEKNAVELEQIDLIRMLDGIWKAFRHYFWVVLLLMLLGGGVFLVHDRMSYSPEYLASATFTVTADTSNIYSSGSYYNNATATQLANTFPYLLTSGTLSKVVAEDLGVEQLNGTITASVLADTNLFTIEVRSSSAQDASDILESVIANYPVVAEQVVGSTVLDLLDDTGVPDAPVNQPNDVRSAAKGALLGLAAGAAFLWLIAFSRRTVQREEDIQKVLHADCLAALPQITLKKRSRKQRQDISILNPHISPGFLEAMRTLRTRLEREAGRQGAQVMLVTSAAPGEGKSTIAANLAMSLAQNGKRVLLMDCDIRNPSVADLLGLSAGKGVYELLSGSAELEEVFRYDKEHGLYVLPGGKPCDNASEILDSPQMARIIAGVRGLVDYVILDTAPVGMLTDTAVLAELADGAIFVVRQDYAQIAHLADAVEQLSESRVPLLGCVLNGAAATLGGYGGYSGYGGSYGGYGHYGHYGHYSHYSSGQTEQTDRTDARK